MYTYSTAAWTPSKYAVFVPLSSSSTEFRKIPWKHRNSVEMGKFRSSAQNSALRRKLWSLLKALLITHPTASKHWRSNSKSSNHMQYRTSQKQIVQCQENMQASSQSENHDAALTIKEKKTQEVLHDTEDTNYHICCQFHMPLVHCSFCRTWNNYI